MKLDSFETKKENVVTFSLNGSNLKFANFLRRAIISQVPVVAIDSITFYENSSTIFDEYLSHRIGLVPLKTPKMVAHDAEFIFVLDEKGPKKVCSGDLKPADHKIVPAVEDIPIVTLLEDQSLRLEAKANVGNGKIHAKYQSGIATYKVDEKTGDINFRVESFYQTDPKNLIQRALKVSDKDLSSLEKEVNKIK